MAKVICTLPNVSAKINGVRFTADRGEYISDEISDEAALNFASIPGYRIAEVPAAKPAKGAAAADPTPDKK